MITTECLATSVQSNRIKEITKHEKGNGLSGAFCETNQIFFARINLCGLLWGDIVLALKDCKKSEIFGDWEQWHDGWVARAEFHQSQGNEAYKNNHLLTARDSFLKASACYHLSEFFFFENLAKKEKSRRHVTRLFKKAIPLMGHPVKQATIVSRGCHMPVYLLIPGDSKSYPCVILNNGADSAKEAELYAFAKSFLERGIAVCLFDGPGQGELMESSAMVVHWEDVIEDVISYLNTQEEIDTERLGMFGVSFGAYLCLRAAAHHQDKIKAVINLSGFYHIGDIERFQSTMRNNFCYIFKRDFDAMHALASAQLDLKNVPNLKKPLYTIHSKSDGLFPFDNVRLIDSWARGEHKILSYEGEWHVCTNRLPEFTSLFCDWMMDHLSN